MTGPKTGGRSVTHNSGKTPALKLTYLCCMGGAVLWSDPIPDYDVEFRKAEENRVAMRRQTQERMSAAIREHPEIAAQMKAMDRQADSIFNALFDQSGVLAPTVINTVQIRGSSDWAIRNEKDLPRTVYLIGKFTYHDIFKGTKEHTTKFCLMRTQGNSFAICPKSNSMD